MRTSLIFQIILMSIYNISIVIGLVYFPAIMTVLVVGNMIIGPMQFFSGIYRLGKYNTWQLKTYCILSMVTIIVMILNSIANLEKEFFWGLMGFSVLMANYYLYVLYSLPAKKQ